MNSGGFVLGVFSAVRGVKEEQPPASLLSLSSPKHNDGGARHLFFWRFLGLNDAKTVLGLQRAQPPHSKTPQPPNEWFCLLLMLKITNRSQKENRSRGGAGTVPLAGGAAYLLIDGEIPINLLHLLMKKKKHIDNQLKRPSLTS